MKTAASYFLKPSDVEEVRFYQGWFYLDIKNSAAAKLAKRGVKDPFQFRIYSEVKEEVLSACCAVAAPGLFYLSKTDADSLCAALNPRVILDEDNELVNDFYDDLWDDSIGTEELLSFLQKLPRRLLRPAFDAFFDNIARCTGCKTLLFTLPEPLCEESSRTHWIVRNSSARALNDFRAKSNHGNYYIRGFIWNRPGTAAPAEPARWEAE